MTREEKIKKAAEKQEYPHSECCGCNINDECSESFIKAATWAFSESDKRITKLRAALELISYDGPSHDFYNLHQVAEEALKEDIE